MYFLLLKWETGQSYVLNHVAGDRVDTTLAIGKLMVTALNVIEEFEADMIKER